MSTTMAVFPSIVLRRAAPATTGSRRRRPLTTMVVATFAASAALALLGASPAAAVDNSLASATPAPNTTIDVSPATLVLTFASPLGPTNTVTLTCGAEGQPAAVISTPKPLVLADLVTLSVTLTAPIPKGVCNVVWRVTDTNLQPAGSGSYTFVVANDTVVTAPTTTTTVPGQAVDPTATTPTSVAGQPTTGTVDGAETETVSDPAGPLGLFRWMSNLFVAVLFGAIVTLATCWPSGVDWLETQRFLRTVYALALVSTVLFAGALAAHIGKASLASSMSPTGWGPLIDTAHGKAALLRLAFTAATGWVVVRPERAIDPSFRLQALGLPAIAIVTMGFDRPDFGLIEWFAGIVHAAAVSLWFGGLALMVRVVLAGRGDDETTAAVRQYSRWSTPVLWAAVGSGVVLLFRLDRGELGSSHGLVLIVKTIVVAMMVFVAMAARQFVAEALSTARRVKKSMVFRLRRALTIEAIIGLVVLALTSWLMALSPPGLVRSEGPTLDLGPPHRFVNSTLNADIVVSFSETVGANDVRIEVVTPTTELADLVVEFLPPAGSTVNGLRIAPIPLTGAGAAVLEKTDGFSLGSSGTWTVVVRLGSLEVARSDVFVGSELATPTSTTSP
ncbi:MAG: copper resistance CopC/CopD family protein [Ilumatobacteraceae bacterium]